MRAGIRTTVARASSKGIQRPKFHPASAERWADLAELFGPKGACAGCWCQWPRVAAAEFRRGLGDDNRRALRRLVGSDRPAGVLAYFGDRAVGWCAIAPRVDYRRLETSRVLKPVDEHPVWSIVCMFVAREHRGQGLTVRLIREACRYAAERGAREVEGYPIDAKTRQAAAFIWWGTASAFRRAGFHEVARRSATRPIVRRAVRARAGAKRVVERAPRPARAARSARG